MGRLFSACNSTFDDGDDGDDDDDIDYDDNNDDDDVDYDDNDDDDCGYSAPLFSTQFHFQPNLNFDLLAPQSQMKRQGALCKKKSDWKRFTNTSVFDIMGLGELFHHPPTKFMAFDTFLQKCSSFEISWIFLNYSTSTKNVAKHFVCLGFVVR